MGRRIVELHGPADYSPDDAAHALSLLLDRPIEAIPATDTDWSSNMLDKGFPKITVGAFVEMFAGFNSGHIAFEECHERLHGQVSLHDALSAVLQLSRDH